ncbi:MAG: hypothetical protein ACPGVX_11470, partial [Thalassobaculaceae bacterium]
SDTEAQLDAARNQIAVLETERSEQDAALQAANAQITAKTQPPMATVRIIFAPFHLALPVRRTGASVRL